MTKCNFWHQMRCFRHHTITFMFNLNMQLVIQDVIHDRQLYWLNFSILFTFSIRPIEALSSWHSRVKCCHKCSQVSQGDIFVNHGEQTPSWQGEASRNRYQFWQSWFNTSWHYYHWNMTANESNKYKQNINYRQQLSFI